MAAKRVAAINPPIDDTDPIRKFSVDPGSHTDLQNPAEFSPKGKPIRNFSIDPTSSIRTRLRTPFLRTPFPRLLHQLKRRFWEGVAEKPLCRPVFDISSNNLKDRHCLESQNAAAEIHRNYRKIAPTYYRTFFDICKIMLKIKIKDDISMDIEKGSARPITIKTRLCKHGNAKGSLSVLLCRFMESLVRVLVSDPSFLPHVALFGCSVHQ